MVIKLRLSIFENKKSKWETLIINHYKSASKRNKEYSKVHSLDEMRAWWFNILEKNDENEIEEFILAVTEANEKNIIYHPI